MTDNASNVRRDLLIVIAAALLTWFVAGMLDLAERWIDWAALGEHYQLDEVIFVLLTACIGLMWFGRRRYTELRQVLEQNLAINASLAQQHQQVEALLGQNRALINHVTLLRESERSQLAAELHDVFGQYLAAIDVNASVGLKLAESESKLHQILTAIQSSATFLRNATRSKLRSIKPPGLETIGLSAVVKELVSQWETTLPDHFLDLRLNVQDELVNYDIALTIYRCLQEGLVNISRHAEASEVLIDIRSDFYNDAGVRCIRLLLSDNGRGFDIEEQLGNGLGLIGIRERVLAFAGDWRVYPSEPTGTTICLSIPLDTTPVNLSN